MKYADMARKIVQQALNHESAIETKISVATLLIGIEHELKATRHQKDVVKRLKCRQ